MKNKSINIRDPFVLYENGTYYMYGTRAKRFGMRTGGFDVYTSTDLENWSSPKECFNSQKYNMNLAANWAPEVHKYKGSYYMFATFTRANGKRGTFSLKAEHPLGPFEPLSTEPVTPAEWECLDGTLYRDKNNKPYLVFCHEHTEILNGTICYIALSEDLTKSVGEAVTLFKATDPDWADAFKAGKHYVTDGPFLYRTKSDELFMIWSTFIKGKYCIAPVKFKGGEIGTELEHMKPIVTNHGGHGMIFEGKENVFLTYHYPNTSRKEHPVFKVLTAGEGALTLNTEEDKPKKWLWLWQK